MTRHIRVRAIKRREVDEDKLALAFLMLARVLHEQAGSAAADAARPPSSSDPETT